MHEILSSDDAAIQRMEVRITIAKQIAIGMVHLHYNRPPIIHYDLKAVNILVERKGDDDIICKASRCENIQIFMTLLFL